MKVDMMLFCLTLIGAGWSNSALCEDQSILESLFLDASTQKQMVVTSVSGRRKLMSSKAARLEDPSFSCLVPGGAPTSVAIQKPG